MFYRTENEAVGILNDWDMAVATEDLANNFGFECELELKRRQGSFPAVLNASNTDRDPGGPSAALSGDSVRDPSAFQGRSGRSPSPSERAVAAKSSRLSSARSTSNVPTNASGSRKLQSVPSESQQPGQGEENTAQNMTQATEAMQDRQKTGTGPFMALELLDPNGRTSHRYRFDLESFLYVLIWFCVGFRPSERKIKPILEWTTPNMSRLLSDKTSFITYDSFREQTFSEATEPACTRVLQRGVEHLIRALYGKITASKTISELLNDYVAMETHGRELCELCELRQKIEVQIVERESWISYDMLVGALTHT